MRYAERGVVFLVVAALLAMSCGAACKDRVDPDFGIFPVPPDQGGTPTPTPSPGTGLAGGVLVQIASQGEVFHVWVTNAAAIQALEAVWSGAIPMPSIGGALRAGQGRAHHNAPWNWHLDPEQIGLDVAGIPEAIGKPSQVEANLTHWLSALGWCQTPVA